MNNRQQHLEISKFIKDWQKENVYTGDLNEHNKKFRVEFSVFLSSFSPEIKKQYLK